ncbi:olfactomedin [Lampris incognitus]|uniref:olfactomedin n=1 Tax=Lampris incognitus TaxID=2546036 RepID=UPI0024B53CEA|nr:olfactomedin [Lampris incognitus]
MLLLVLLLSSAAGGQAQRIPGQLKDGSCACPVNSSMWSFPALRYEAVLQQVEKCEDSWRNLQTQVVDTGEHLPRMQALFQNLTARLVPYQYLNDKGLYSRLALVRLSQELQQVQADITSVHNERQSTQTRKLLKEVAKLQKDAEKMHMSQSVNMRSVKIKLRYLKNGVESCRSIPKDFRGPHSHCFKGVMSKISKPEVTKISPYGKSYLSGSWGKQAKQNSPGDGDSYWVMPLTQSGAWGNTLRLYSSYEDFMASAGNRDFSFASSYSHSNANEGPSAVLYDDAFFYHCRQSIDICRYNLTDKSVTRVPLPGNGVGYNNKFPYCYYDCRAYSDVDLEADETGLWVIYATLGNHGNLAVSRLSWEGGALNVTNTWETQLFKKAVSNAFMACGVLYATRYVDDYYDEVFYAFDTATGREDNSLALRLEKVAKGVASLSYNPTDRRIYMYNDGYLLAYKAEF